MTDENGNDPTSSDWLEKLQAAPAQNPGQQTPAQTTGQNPGQSPAQAAAARARLNEAFGQIVMALAGIPRYRHMSLADLQTLVLDPLVRDRIAIASARPEDGDKSATGVPAGLAIWGSVSEAVDEKIQEQVKAGVFPVRLKAEDWVSGDKVWLFDVIAPSRQVASAVLANFQQVVKTPGEMRIHPVVARQIDPELLKKMGATVTETNQKPAGAAQ